MTRKTTCALLLLSGAALMLTACGGGGASVATPATPTAMRIEDSFGTKFGVDYRTSPNTQPVKPAQGDIIALTLTAAPLPLH